MSVGEDGLSAAAESEPPAPAAAGDPNTVLIPAGAYDPANAATAYSPTQLTVAVGTTVTWINQDSVFHTITSGRSAGTFDHSCTPHPWMSGQIEVTG